jgi:hypothetical protein
MVHQHVSAHVRAQYLLSVNEPLTKQAQQSNADRTISTTKLNNVCEACVSRQSVALYTFHFCTDLCVLLIVVIP